MSPHVRFQAIKEFVRSHWYGTVVATLASLLFFGASLYVEEIRGAVPFYWGPFDSWSIPALLFWGGLLVVTSMLAAKNAADESARQELVDATERVRQLVQTMPPRTWRDDYAGAVNTACDGLNGLLPRRPESGIGTNELVEIVRRLLASIATLAYRFDDQPRLDNKAASYAANIMIFHPRKAREPYFEPAVAKAMLFLPTEYSLEHLSGVLCLVPQLSFSTTSPAGPDIDVPAIALPVPINVKSDKGRWRVLPGAPMALAVTGIDGYDDVASLPEWFNTVADFPGSVRDNVREYFDGPGRASKSFVSRRLMSAEDPLGVLNLHSNKTNLLGAYGVGTDVSASASRREEFFAIMTPLLRELETVVGLYRAAAERVAPATDR